MEQSGPGSQRWQGNKSAYPWEAEALDHIRAQLPDAEPYRAWQCITFTGPNGHIREVDLLIAVPGGLYLVEIKSHPGTAANNGSTWLFRDGDRLRTIENPLHFTDAKAKELKTQLEHAARKLKVREPIPRIEAAVFLSAPTLVCRFDEFQLPRIYGRDDKAKQTQLPGIWTGLLSRPPASERNRVTPALSRQLPKLLHAIGIARPHRIGKVGPYELEPKSFDGGPTWEDYLASNPSLAADYPRRVRVYLTERTASADERKSTQRAAYREYLALQDISHDGIVRAETYSEELQAGPAVVFRHGKDWQRLDHFMAGHGADLPLDTRLEMIRQLAEALDHAHRRHLYHRALAPRAVYVELDGRYPRLRIADWQVAARPHGTGAGTGTSAAGGHGTGTAISGSGPAALAAHVERSAGPYLAPEFQHADASPALLDVFGLGAIGYLILTGRAPAATREQLAQRLVAEHALVPSTVTDSVTPAMDALVRDATQTLYADRTESVRAFLRTLDEIEEELTRPDAAPEKDPLTANPGDEIDGWKVASILGKGSTSRALLVTREGSDPRVFKVALTGAATGRLHREAAQLAPLNDSHVARLLNQPFEAGPDGKRRTLIGVEYVGDHTLADELRQYGQLTIHELERLGEDLFQAVTFLDKRGIWHRDIKPDNLALRELDRKGRELVLFDFSQAGTPDSDIAAGTKDYLDPFLGPPARLRYDQAAELYAAAVTLHEMASGELPSWGDDQADPRFLDPGEEVQLAEDRFDPVIRDGLVEFFTVALARDASRRHTSLREMAHAWSDVFRDLETIPPLTTAATASAAETAGVTGGEPADQATVERLRVAAAAAAAYTTPLAAAGLSQHALSVAQGLLGAHTAGDLARVPAKRITALRGIGSRPRYELVRRSREWRQRFNVPEAGLPRADTSWVVEDSPPPVPHEEKDQAAAERLRTAPSAPAPAQVAEDLRHLAVDEVVRLLVPEDPALQRVMGVLAARDGGRPVSPWASQQDIARATGIPEAEVAAHLDRLRNRWLKSVPALLPVRDELAEILREHGRVLGWRQLAAGLLARRGSELGDAAERLRQAAICVRAAVETEERRDGTRMTGRRLGVPAGAGAAGSPSDDRVLVALRETADTADDIDHGTAPRADDLFGYAERLGGQADLLSARDPLPGVPEIRRVLRDVDAADNATRLSDTDLVLLAAAASEKTAATPRLELYPRDLSAERALRISQAGSIADKAFADELARRITARFPDLYEANRPAAADIPGLLRGLGYDVTKGMDSRLYIASSTQQSGPRGSRWPAAPAMQADAAAEARAHAAQRFADALRRGGFLTVKTRVEDSTPVRLRIAAMDGVTAVNVSALFVRTLRGLVDAAGRPRWETVLAADSPQASQQARNGFAGLLRQTWARVEEHIRAAGDGGIVALHDATPIARYTGGAELLAKLTVAARDAAEAPFGLWLLCPMENPAALPLLDALTVSVIPGDAEQLHVPAGFADDAAGGTGTSGGTSGGKGQQAS